MTADYGYDGQGRLTSIIYKRLGVQFGDLGYGYDNQGRRVRMTGSLARVGLTQPVSGTSYNAANQLTSWNGATLSYDTNGNMTSDGTSTFAWNARNQLSSISGAASASFVYDPLGRRINKTVNGVTTQFLYDGDNVVKEIRAGGSAEILTGGTDQFFSRNDASGQRVIVADGLGSVLGLADGAGNTTTSYTYDAFGGTSVSGAASDNANQYTSRENDGTGLYFYRARYYSARLGRFVSEDPTRQAGSGHNVYSYVRNAPTNFVDPTGLTEFGTRLVLGGIGALTAGLGNYIGQLIANGGDPNCIKWSDVLIAGFVGFVSGFVAPTDTAVAIANGGVANVIQYALTQLNNGETPELDGIILSALTGAFSGWISGAVAQSWRLPTDPNTRYAVGEFAGSRNLQIELAEAVGLSSFLRNALGGIVANLPTKTGIVCSKSKDS